MNSIFYLLSYFFTLVTPFNSFSSILPYLVKVLPTFTLFVNLRTRHHCFLSWRSSNAESAFPFQCRAVRLADSRNTSKYIMLLSQVKYSFRASKQRTRDDGNWLATYSNMRASYFMRGTKITWLVDVIIYTAKPSDAILLGDGTWLSLHEHTHIPVSWLNFPKYGGKGHFIYIFRSFWVQDIFWCGKWPRGKLSDWDTHDRSRAKSQRG